MCIDRTSECNCHLRLKPIIENCDGCDGSGVVECTECDDTGQTIDNEGLIQTCDDCGGEGVVKCGVCDGEGRYYFCPNCDEYLEEDIEAESECPNCKTMIIWEE